VRKGDTVYSVAKRYGVTAKQIMAQNNLKSSKLHQGQTLAVNSANPIASQKPAIKVAKATVKKGGTAEKKTRYIVKRGETLASIAKKFNVATADLQRWNNLSGSRIQPGHKLTIYKPDAA
jgi:membrane-bound lytic murein transglycosylase D